MGYTGRAPGLAMGVQRLTDPVEITLSGDANGSISIDGTEDVVLSVGVQDDSHNHIISNVDGLQASLDGKLDSTAKAVDSDKLDGYNAEALVSYHSFRDFPNGTLIQTNIDYSVEYGDSWLIEIRGNSYGNIVPLNVKYQGYIYANTIISHGGVTIGNNYFTTGMVAFNYNGNLCFWFPNRGYWQGYWISVISTSIAGITKNRVTLVTDSTKPSGITKEVALSTWKVV